MSNTHNWVVLKFGGTSVKSLADWRVISKRISEVKAEGKRVFVVHSAVAKISDLLDALVRSAVAGDGEAELGIGAPNWEWYVDGPSEDPGAVYVFAGTEVTSAP